MRPVLVLVHGTRFDSRQWDGYADLVPEADVVTVDLPGHGARVGHAYTTTDALAAIDEAIAPYARPADDSGEPLRPVVLAGHSLGGYAATTYTQRHPGGVDVLVLIGASADPARHRILRHLYTGFARVLPAVGAERMGRVTDRVMTRLGAEADRLPGTEGYAVLPDAWAATMAEASPQQLAELTCPVFLVGGWFDQLVVDVRAYARACRDPRVRLIPRATHFAPTTHREQVAAILREAVAASTARRADPR